MVKKTPSKSFYLIQGFDLSNWEEFIPDPALFQTQHEAIDWVAEHTTSTVKYNFQQVKVGNFQ